MTIRDLSSDEITPLIGTRHDITGVEFPPAGLQPYHDWLIRQLYHLSENAAGAFRVARDDANDTTVFITPGRASISSVVLDYAGGTLDLATHNNDTAYVWLEDNAGSASIGSANDATGWPAGSHIKLAEVVLVAGVITSVLDRRFETMLSV